MSSYSNADTKNESDQESEENTEICHTNANGEDAIEEQSKDDNINNSPEACHSNAENKDKTDMKSAKQQKNEQTVKRPRRNRAVKQQSNDDNIIKNSEAWHSNADGKDRTDLESEKQKSKKQKRETIKKSTAKIVRKEEIRPKSQIRYDRIDHWIQHDNFYSKTRCKYESCTYSTHVFCEKCKVHLCFTAQRNCYTKFHKKEHDE